MVELSLPSNAKEQLGVPRPELIRVTRVLALKLRSILLNEGVDFIASESRTKSLARIMEKINSQGSYPLPDIHGILFQIEEDSFETAFSAIRTVYPTPEIFPWGFDSRRDKRDPKIQDKYNAASHPCFRPLIFNVVIPQGAKIAEVQLMTPEVYQIGKETRKQYVVNQRFLRSIPNSNP